MKINVLKGSDFYWQFLTNDIIRGNGGPVAAKSVLGCVLSGPISSTISNYCGVVSTHSLKIAADVKTPDLELNTNIEKFWDLESVGITEEKSFVDEYKEKIKFNGERYEVELPFKENISGLTNDYDVCESRL